MADFVAVIRRAVDGLSENTPEMRVKVYERARGAVQRQLESMKPRPPEHMLQRQLEKLEAAIREVEGEHAEALPPMADAGAEVPAAVPDEEAHAAPYEPVEEYAPANEAPEHVEPAPEEVYEEHATVRAHGEDTESVEAYPVHHEEAASHAVAPADEAAEDWRHAEAHQPEEPVAYAPAEPVAASPSQHPEAEAVEEEAEIRYPFDGPAHHGVEPVAYEGSGDAFIERTQDEPLQTDGSAHFKQPWFEPAPETPVEPQSSWEPAQPEEPRKPAATVALAAEPANDIPPADEQVAAKMPAATENFGWEAAAFDDLPPVEPVPAKKASASAQFGDDDLFADVHGKADASKSKEGSTGDWRHVEELTGFGKADMGAAETKEGASTQPDLDQLVAAKLQGKSFRMEPKRRRFGIGTILTILVVLAILGGSGYAAWLNRDALNDMLAGLVSSARQATNVDTPPAEEQAAAPPAATTPAPQTPAPATPAPTAAAPSAPAATTPPRDTAALDNNASDTKFTQRLLADGTEIDNGPAAVPGQPAVEGRSVSEQNVAAADVPPAQGDTTAPAATNGSDLPQTTASAATNGAVQKMFLYEERLGQSSPTAIEGSVTWSVQQEADDDGRTAPTVQGKVSVPERNLSALITFKRNGDPSLPASHLVEIVFSLPPNFEGGSIDSVQRIAMKQTEQDRGDALIAVPAKITDDFYMVALNDYPDARKANLDLLGTRNWIDIPVTYRNGRRALLTMEKGPAGVEAFNTAIKAWTALGDTSTSQ
ncbi:hypothetical protein [Rhizobium sp. BK251]|uniref:hypothetical protein n=1 Tax=Rhizobium sp. BK251 TaxID=2512125 RepID=UPI001051E107|nr:hypothetical protein [Rhizobium sp. BK251]TCL65118.1 hypothetical protein EV286_11313 [Rhizobium sp. BK251]